MMAKGLNFPTKESLKAKYYKAMSVLRIELTERVVTPPDPDEADRNENLKLPPPKAQVTYRRIYPRLRDIFCPREIPGIAKYCEIEFVDGSVIFVKGSFDDNCIKLNDVENGTVEDGNYDGLEEEE
jgi:hypothetical protein